MPRRPKRRGLIQKPADQTPMADQGRREDDEVAHVAEGEVVLPANVRTPEFMADVREHFERLGVPIDRYTVQDTDQDQHAQRFFAGQQQGQQRKGMMPQANPETGQQAFNTLPSWGPERWGGGGPASTAERQSRSSSGGGSGGGFPVNETVDGAFKLGELGYDAMFGSNVGASGFSAAFGSGAAAPGQAAALSGPLQGSQVLGATTPVGGTAAGQTLTTGTAAASGGTSAASAVPLALNPAFMFFAPALAGVASALMEKRPPTASFEKTEDGKLALGHVDMGDTPGNEGKEELTQYLTAMVDDTNARIDAGETELPDELPTLEIGADGVKGYWESDRALEDQQQGDNNPSWRDGNRVYTNTRTPPRPVNPDELLFGSMGGPEVNVEQVNEGDNSFSKRTFEGPWEQSRRETGGGFKYAEPVNTETGETLSEFEARRRQEYAERVGNSDWRPTAGPAQGGQTAPAGTLLPGNGGTGLLGQQEDEDMNRTTGQQQFYGGKGKKRRGMMPRRNPETGRQAFNAGLPAGVVANKVADTPGWTADAAPGYGAYTTPDSFNTAGYLENNPDVQKAVDEGAFKSAYQHYVEHGQSEGRLPGGTVGDILPATPYDTEDEYRAAMGRGGTRETGSHRVNNTEIVPSNRAYDAGAAEAIMADKPGHPYHRRADAYHESGQGRPALDGGSTSGGAPIYPADGGDGGGDAGAPPWFDAQWYRAQYPDVDAAITAGEVAGAYDHFTRYGVREGRQPNGGGAGDPGAAPGPSGVGSVDTSLPGTLPSVSPGGTARANLGSGSGYAQPRAYESMDLSSVYQETFPWWNEATGAQQMYATPGRRRGLMNGSSMNPNTGAQEFAAADLSGPGGGSGLPGTGISGGLKQTNGGYNFVDDDGGVAWSFIGANRDQAMQQARDRGFDVGSAAPGGGRGPGRDAPASVSATSAGGSSSGPGGGRGPGSDVAPGAKGPGNIGATGTPSTPEPEPESPAPTSTPSYSTPAISKPAESSYDYDSVEDRLDGILEQGSPLMDRARTQGLQSANRRGLLNSSIAAEAAQGAMIDRALPIAQQDSGQSFQTSTQRRGLDTEERMQSRDIRSNEFMQGRELSSRERLLSMELGSRERLQAADNAAAKDRLGMQLTSEEGRLVTELEAAQERQDTEYQAREGLLERELQSQARLQFARDAAAKDRLGMQLSTDERTALNQLLSAENRLDAELGSREALQAQSLNVERELNQLDADTRSRLGELDANVRREIANLQVRNNEQQAAVNAAIDVESLYGQMFNTLSQNPNIPADVRESYLNHISATRDSNLGLVEQFYDVDLEWDSPTAGGGSTVEAA